MNSFSSLAKMTWKGFLRKDGRIGIRNKVLVIYTVECAHFVVEKIVRLIDNKDVEEIGFTGCCDNEYAVRMLLALARHPNVGAVLAIGLGCEYVQPDAIAEKAREAGLYAESFYIQKVGGTFPAVQKGIAIVKDFLMRLHNTKLVDMSLKDLVIGSECGGSDFTSGLAGNAVVGKFYDYLIDIDGTAIFEEIMEGVGLKNYLVDRGETPVVKEEIGRAYDKMIKHCQSICQYSISPGNFMGGLSSIEEKSMGSMMKSGTRPISGVLKCSMVPRRHGLWLLDSVPDDYFMGFGKTNPNDSEGIFDLISCGCQLILFVTGRGSDIGSAISPTLKVTGNKITFLNMHDDLDFCAGPIIDGTLTMEEMSKKLAELIIAVSSGKQLTCAEKLGHKEYYIPYKYQNIGQECANFK